MQVGPKGTELQARLVLREEKSGRSMIGKVAGSKYFCTGWAEILGVRISRLIGIKE